MATARQFKNFTGEDFAWKFDGIEYSFPAGSTLYLEDFKAEHFTKHLVDKEMNRLGLPTNGPRRAEFEAQCAPSVEEVTPMQALDLNEKVKKTKKEVKSAEFEDLQVKPRKK